MASGIGESQKARESREERERREKQHDREVAKREREREEAKKAEAPGAPGMPIYNPGVENPTPSPFMTQQDIEEYAEAREQYEGGLHELDRNYEAQKHSNEYEGAEIEKGRVAGVESENWDAAGRGLFKSSIRDGDLADIDAAAEIKKKFLSDSLSTLAVYNEGQKKSMEAKWGRFEESERRKEVENAEGVSASMPKYSVEPHVEFAPVKAGGAAPVPKKAPVRGQTIMNPTAQKSKNGGITAPPPNPSISPGQKATAASHMGVANSAIAGRLYGK